MAEYIRDNYKDFYWVHVYGMAMECIKKYVPGWERLGIQVSVDSTKWTRKTREGHQPMMCSKETRNDFFINYCTNLKKYGIEVEW